MRLDNDVLGARFDGLQCGSPVVERHQNDDGSRWRPVFQSRERDEPCRVGQARIEEYGVDRTGFQRSAGLVEARDMADLQRGTGGPPERLGDHPGLDRLVFDQHDAKPIASHLKAS